MQPEQASGANNWSVQIAPGSGASFCTSQGYVFQKQSRIQIVLFSGDAVNWMNMTRNIANPSMAAVMRISWLSPTYCIVCTSFEILTAATIYTNLFEHHLGNSGWQHYKFLTNPRCCWRSRENESVWSDTAGHQEKEGKAGSQQIWTAKTGGQLIILPFPPESFGFFRGFIPMSTGSQWLTSASALLSWAHTSATQAVSGPNVTFFAEILLEYSTS